MTCFYFHVRCVVNVWSTSVCTLSTPALDLVASCAPSLGVPISLACLALACICCCVDRPGAEGGQARREADGGHDQDHLPEAGRPPGRHPPAVQQHQRYVCMRFVATRFGVVHRSRYQTIWLVSANVSLPHEVVWYTEAEIKRWQRSLQTVGVPNEADMKPIG